MSVTHIPATYNLTQCFIMSEEAVVCHKRLPILMTTFMPRTFPLPPVIINKYKCLEKGQAKVFYSFLNEAVIISLYRVCIPHHNGVKSNVLYTFTLE